jgi:hypothetical protein
MSDYERAKVGDTIILGGVDRAIVIEVGVKRGAARGVKVTDGGQYARFVQDWCVHLAPPAKK